MSWTRGTQTGQDRVAMKDGGTDMGVDDTNAPYTTDTEYHIVLTVEPPLAEDDSVQLHPGGMAAIPVLQNDSGTGLHPGSVEIQTPPARPPSPCKPWTLFPDSPSKTHSASAPPPAKPTASSSASAAAASVPDVNAATPERHVMLDISSLVSFDNTNEGELGLLSFDFHPDFAENGHVYVFYMAPGSPYFCRVSRFTLTKDGGGQPILDNPVAEISTQLILINQHDRDFNHNAGDIHFGPDGYLRVHEP